MVLAVLIPNCPYRLSPHAHTVPSFFSARVCEPPASIFLTSSKSCTCVGIMTFTAALFPICPEVPIPVQYTFPSLVRMTEKSFPADTCFALSRFTVCVIMFPSSSVTSTSFCILTA